MGGDDQLQGCAGNDIYRCSRDSSWDSILDENVILSTNTHTEAWTDSWGLYSLIYIYENANGQTKIGTTSQSFSYNGTRQVEETIRSEIDGGADTLLPGAGITFEDLAVKTIKNDLTIALRNESAGITNDTDGFASLKDRIRIQEWNGTKKRVKTLKFADGAEIDLTNLTLAKTGDAGNDTLVGGTGKDTLTRGVGNDRLIRG